MITTLAQILPHAARKYADRTALIAASISLRTRFHAGYSSSPPFPPPRPAKSCDGCWRTWMMDRYQWT